MMERVVLAVLLVSCVLLVSARDDLNTCIDDVSHTDTPSPEPQLFGECTPWKSRSCCTVNSTIEFQQKGDRWNDFDLNHCRNLSDSCLTWFLRDLCFYECSPNQGPWITPVKGSKTRNERFLHVPFCHSECDSWWSACKNDFTCLADWSHGFNWTSGTNVCPTGNTCRPFTEVYGNSTKFCQIVWGGSYTVVPNTQPCMTLHFNGTNPNDAVARQYSKTSGGSGLSFCNPVNLIISLFYALGRKLL